jgi:hypothetical protein
MHSGCLFCGGDPREPNHAARCDGRQGFIEAERYPDAAGWKEPTTSQAAAASVDASHLRAVVRECLAMHGALTADECAARLGLSVLTIRPRFSELRAKGEITDTGIRHFNRSGKRAIVWRRAS